MNRFLKQAVFPGMLILLFLSLSCDKTVDLNNPFDPIVAIYPPQNFHMISATETSIILTWVRSNMDLNEEQEKMTSIVIEKSTDGTNYLVVDSLDVFASCDTIVKVFIADQTYYFRAYTKVGLKKSSGSDIVQYKISPYAPSHFQVVTANDTLRKLSWTDNSSSEMAFRIEREFGTDGTYDLLAEIPANTTIFRDTTVILTDVTYYYRICAEFSEGLQSPYDSLEICISFPSPSIVLNGGTDPKFVSLQWSSNFLYPVGSAIERSDDSLLFFAIGTAGPGVSAFSDSTINYTRTYYYRIRNFSSHNISPYSEVFKAYYDTTINYWY